MARFLYIMEGEIEDKFILFLQQKKILKPGKRQVFNLMQSRLKQSSNIMTNIYDKVICIIDTDVCGKSELGCFCDNLNILKTISAGNIGLMVQHYNFEDELRKISQENDLGKLVGAKHSHTTEIKSILAQKVDYNKLYKSFKIHEYCDFGNKFEGVLHEYGLSLPKKVEFITLKK